MIKKTSSGVATARRGKTAFAAAVVAVSTLVSAPVAFADRVQVKIENLTSAIYFTPLLAVAHSRSVDLFSVGKPASDAIATIAEGGDVSLAQAAAENAGAVTAVAPDLLAPGKSVTLELSTNNSQRFLTVAGMLLPTNDGFVGIDSVRIPRKWYRRTVDAIGYDAGTERNNEVINGGGPLGVLGIPADPGGNSGTGASGVSASTGGPVESTYIHIHRGILGDRDATGGESDLDSAVHQWQNPVARITITHRPNRAKYSGK